MKKYIKILDAGKNRLIILSNNMRFDTRTGVPNNSFEVWKAGKTKYVALLPEAKELFLKEKVTDLIEYVNKSFSIEDIAVLASVKPDSTTLQDAAKKRTEFLTNNS